ncbi:hypothetical protein BDZ89DRAFT_1130785 [Hymenopellis radicata]|nr:hypothetical protein BDZ89DRAFT_1130785 [Hymenopellis radicata]
MSMSSGEESAQEQPPPPRAGWKKRRLQGACDGCRKKKIKCDSGNMPDGQCTHCRSFGSPCTHIEPPKKRGPKSSYVTKLERRVLQLEQSLKLSQEGQDPDDARASPQSSRLSPEEEAEKESDLSFIGVMDSVKKLSLQAIDGRYFGPASNISFMNEAFLKVHGREPGPGFSVKREHWRNWLLHPWEEDAALSNLALVFPPPDLLVSLISLYFSHFHPYLPLFHQPSFRRAVVTGLHLHDARFGGVLLLVCAIGARASNDPRVFLDGQSEHSSGWKWFQQVRSIPRGLFETPSLYDLQHCVLSAEFVMGTSMPQSSWTMIGLGIRYSIEMGVHRHRPGPPSAETELKKRAFWALILMDRHLGFYHGRPSALHYEDFDIELPIACDDEYWDTFEQPEGKPSTIDYFVCHLKLCQIMSLALRSLYSIRRTKNDGGMEALTQLDSLLNAWFGKIPQHLVWDPSREPILFFDQSAVLHAIWYNIQIQIHRPFIVPKGTPLSSSSLAICRSAARSCARVLDTQREKGRLMMFGFTMSAFAAGIVLSLTMWGNKREGWSTEKETEDIERCLRVLQATERRWNISGRLIDILKTLMSDVRESTIPTERPAQDEMEIALSGGHPTQYHAVGDQFMGGSHAYDPSAFGFTGGWPVQAAPITQIPTTYSPEIPHEGLAMKEVTMNVWSNTPMGFNWADWDAYVSAMPPSQ